MAEMTREQRIENILELIRGIKEIEDVRFLKGWIGGEMNRREAMHTVIDWLGNAAVSPDATFAEAALNAHKSLKTVCSIRP